MVEPPPFSSLSLPGIYSCTQRSIERRTVSQQTRLIQVNGTEPLMTITSYKLLTFSNLDASLLDHSLYFPSAFPESFSLNHLLSLHAPTQSSLFRKSAKHTSLANFASCADVFPGDPAFCSSSLKIARSELISATWTLPAVIPFPRGPLSSNILSKNCRRDCDGRFVC
jgi:hypothetical protein